HLHPTDRYPPPRTHIPHPTREHQQERAPIRITHLTSHLMPRPLPHPLRHPQQPHHTQIQIEHIRCHMRKHPPQPRRPHPHKVPPRLPHQNPRIPQLLRPLLLPPPHAPPTPPRRRREITPHRPILTLPPPPETRPAHPR